MIKLILCEWIWSDFKILKLIFIFFIGFVVKEICKVLLIFFDNNKFKLIVDFIEFVWVLFVLVIFKCRGCMICFVSKW